MRTLASSGAVAAAVPPPVDRGEIQEYCRAIVAALPDATVIVVGRDERIWLAEGLLLQRHEIDRESLVGRQLQAIMPKEARMLLERWNAALGGRAQSFDYRTVDGSTLCWVHLTPLLLGREAPAAVAAVIQDITWRYELHEELKAERERLRAAEHLAGFGHWEADLDAGLVRLSSGCMKLLGLRGPSELELEALVEQAPAEVRERLQSTLRTAMESGSADLETDLPRRGQPPRRILVRGEAHRRTDGRSVVSGVAIDVSEVRAAAQARAGSEALMRQGFEASPVGMAVADPVTGRYVKVNEALCAMLGRSRDELLRLRFQDVTHGPDVAADERARQALQDGSCARYEQEKRYVRADGTSLWVSVHVVPIRGDDGEVCGLFSQVVDRTEAKEREERLRREATDLERLHELRAALAEDRLVLYGQPIIDLRDGSVVRHELLLRLVQDDGTILAPGEFLPLAERYGCIDEIDRWVAARAVEMAALGTAVAVNISAASMEETQLLATVRESLARTGADPSLIMFEVTETAVMADIEAGRDFATALRQLGCRFALDDFGTGYGTLTYLKHIPMDLIKIDIEFVRDLSANEADERVVRTIVAMAQEFGKLTIAEGVEDEATLQRLATLGVDFAQGYHIGRPAPLEYSEALS